MKALLFTGLIILLFLPRYAMPESVTFIYQFKSPQVQYSGDYVSVSFDGTVLAGEPGKATIPFYPVRLLLPPGEIALSVSFEFSEPVQMSGNYLLLPWQGPRPISLGAGTEWYEDSQFYSSRDTYPSDFENSIETHFYNGCGIALSSFTPLRYIPGEREVFYYKSVRVTVHTGPDPDMSLHMANHFPSGTKMENLEKLVQNPAAATIYQSGRELRTADYDYLIITPDQYIAEFDTLAWFYKPRGIKSKITSTNYIQANVTGNDLQEKIRNYIIDEYQDFGIDYVLIGGDAELVPYRGFYCYVMSGSTPYYDYGIPADLYYSALDGNWNTDGDNRWAEPEEDDLFPEVAVGRMTFNDTVELHNMLHKTMLFQADPVEGELTRPLLAGEYLYSPPVTWGSDYLKLLIGYRTDNGYSTHGIPPSHPRDTLYDEVFTWTEDTLRAHINSGRPWLHHVGHSNYTYVMKMYNNDITNANFSQANGVNHNYTIVYTHGCMCGGFDVTDCIAEKMVGIDNFAVAFVGNSRYGWFNQGTTDGPSQHLHREFMDAVYHDSLYHIGMAHVRSKAETPPFVEISGEFEPGATRWCFYDNNVLGDPLMAVWTQEPILPQVSYVPMIPIGADSLVVHVSNGGPLHGYTCSLYYSDTLFGSAITNSSGKAVIMIEDYLEERPLSLIVTGFNILPKTYPVHICNSWLGYSEDWSKPSNWLSGVIPDSSTYVIIPSNPPGGHNPDKNSGNERQCAGIFIEPGVDFILRSGETFSIGEN